MEIPGNELMKLFDMLAEKTGESLDFSGFDSMDTQLGAHLNGKYLYNKYNDLTKSPLSHHKMQEIKLKSLLSYLGFQNYRDFQTFLTTPISDILMSCLGVWISFVRQNSNEGILYQSPVQIYSKDQKAFYQLKGPNTTYQGEITYSNGCLTTLFSGSSGKMFHHIYKIGNRKNPKILQGIYSGISTADDPIGGRTILYRTEQKFEEIENKMLRLEDLKQDEDSLYRNMSSYFETFERNNLRLNPIISFGLEDLKSF